MMTIDDEGEGGVWPMMTSSQKSKIFGKYLGFYREFVKIFRKIYKIRTKVFNFSRKFLLR